MSAPVLRLEPRDATRADGAWRVRWRVTNVGSDHVRLLAVRAPHSRFRADPTDLNALVTESVSVEQTLRIEGAPGEDIDNAFVIFVVMHDKETWRVLFRVRVHLGQDGTPAPVVEAMSTHRIGFSEV